MTQSKQQINEKKASSNVVWHPPTISNQKRGKLKDHNACVLWFTGLSGSGKSTIANALDSFLYQQKQHSYLLDGDNIRHGLNSDLGFSDTDRIENIRRISEVSSLFVDAGFIVLTAFISPFTSDRALARTKVRSEQFIEVFIDTSLAECERRDVKGLYQKARIGEIKNFTGIDSAYEKPLNPEIHIKTQGKSVQDCVLEIAQYLVAKKIVTPQMLENCYGNV